MCFGLVFLALFPNANVLAFMAQIQMQVIKSMFFLVAYTDWQMLSQVQQNAYVSSSNSEVISSNIITTHIIQKVKGMAGDGSCLSVSLSQL
jgi:hypothetical protein